MENETEKIRMVEDLLDKYMNMNFKRKSGAYPVEADIIKLIKVPDFKKGMRQIVDPSYA